MNSGHDSPSTATPVAVDELVSDRHTVEQGDPKETGTVVIEVSGVPVSKDSDGASLFEQVVAQALCSNSVEYGGNVRATVEPDRDS